MIVVAMVVATATGIASVIAKVIVVGRRIIVLIIVNSKGQS